MPNTRDIKQKGTPSFLIVGDGGTEKTRFLAQCPKPYVLDFDDGMVSATEFDVEYDTFKDAPYKSKAHDRDRGIYPWGEAWPRMIDHLNSKVWPQLEAGTWPFLTLGVDSLTTLSTQCMNYVMKASGKPGDSNPEIQHWGSQLRLMESLMEQLASWPIRLVVTAHIKRDDNLVMGTKEYLPMVTGQLSGRIGIYFDEVYYTDVTGTGKDRKVVFRTETESMYKQAKSRHHVPTKTPAKWSAVEPHFV